MKKSIYELSNQEFMNLRKEFKKTHYGSWYGLFQGIVVCLAVFICAWEAGRTIGGDYVFDFESVESYARLALLVVIIVEMFFTKEMRKYYELKSKSKK